jgi:hypothetical protein
MMSEQPTSTARALQRLYQKIFLINLRRLLSMFRHIVPAKPDREFARALNHYIDSGPEPSADTRQASPDAPHDSAPVPKKDYSAKAVTPESSHEETPARVRQPRSTDTIADKLRKSTWEHIHAVHRATRQGDKANARMHASIAKSAAAEAGHFMSKADYLEFLAALMEELKRFRN